MTVLAFYMAIAATKHPAAALAGTMGAAGRGDIVLEEAGAAVAIAGEGWLHVRTWATDSVAA